MDFDNRSANAFRLDAHSVPIGAKTISELASKYGVSLRTLRFYEDGGFLSPHRVGLARYYSTADEVRLQVIIKGKKLGFSLREIYDLCFKNPAEGGGQIGLHGNIDLSREQVDQQIQILEKEQARIVEALSELRAMQVADGGG